MFAQLLTWYCEQHNNRRLYPRRQVPFRAWIEDGEAPTPLAGVDVSASGLGVLSLVPLPWGEARFSADIDGHRVAFAARTVWTQEGTMESRHVWRGGFRTTAIAANDWKAILDYCNAGLPSEQHVAEPPAVRIPPDDASRLLPEDLRTRIIDMLSKAGRITIFATHPNMQYTYRGVVHHGDRMLHRMETTSTSIDQQKSQVQTFVTIFLFDDELNTVLMEEVEATPR